MSVLKYENVSWNLPLMFCHDEIIFTLSYIMKELGEKMPTMYTYGSMFSKWAGGRDSSFIFFDRGFVEDLILKIIDAGFVPTFTFTNPRVTDADLQDEFSNHILDFGVKNNCEFIVSADNLYNHIKSRYPEAKCVASILQAKMEFHDLRKRAMQKAGSELLFYNNLLEKFDRVVVRPEYSISSLEKDAEQIKDIKKIEVLINETCIPGCPMAVACYNSKNKLGAPKVSRCGRDIFTSNMGLEKSLNYTLMSKKEFIDNLIYNVGVKHLKIQGRHYHPAFLFSIIMQYIFKTDGGFQSIMPLAREKLKKIIKSNEFIPLEQKYMVETFIKDNVEIM